MIWRSASENTCCRLSDSPLLGDSAVCEGVRSALLGESPICEDVLDRGGFVGVLLLLFSIELVAAPASGSRLGALGCTPAAELVGLLGE